MIYLKFQFRGRPFRSLSEELFGRIEGLRFEGDASGGAQLRECVQVKLPRIVAVVSIFDSTVETSNHLVATVEEQDEMRSQALPSDGLLADIGNDNSGHGRGIPPRQVIVRQPEMPRVGSMHVVLDHQLPAANEYGLSMRFVKVQF